MVREMFTVTEAAEFLRVSAGLLNKLRGLGKGPAFIRLGSRVAYTRADLDSFVEAQRREATAKRPSAADQ